MKENAKFLKCSICDNIIEIIDGDVQHITCCGRKMEEQENSTIQEQQTGRSFAR